MKHEAWVRACVCVFPGPDSMGFVWGGVGRALMQFMHFPASFGMLAVLATSVTPWYPL